MQLLNGHAAAMVPPQHAATLRSLRSAAAHSVMTLRPRPMLVPVAPPPPPPFLVPTATLKKDKGLKHSLRKLTKKYKAPPPPMMVMVPPGPPPHFAPHPIYGPPPGSTFAEPRRRASQLNGYGGEEAVFVPAMRPVTPLSHMHGRLAPYDQPGPSQERPRVHKAKKGHINERAFLHSIRQEQRSRSSSVATVDRKSGHPGVIEVETHFHERQHNGQNGDIARSLESLHLNDHNHSSHVVNGSGQGGARCKSKTASIKRGSAANGLKVGIPVAPPPLPTLVNGGRKK